MRILACSQSEGAGVRILLDCHKNGSISDRRRPRQSCLGVDSLFLSSFWLYLVFSRKGKIDLVNRETRPFPIYFTLLELNKSDCAAF